MPTCPNCGTKCSYDDEDYALVIKFCVKNGLIIEELNKEGKPHKVATQKGIALLDKVQKKIAQSNKQDKQVPNYIG